MKLSKKFFVLVTLVLLVTLFLSACALEDSEVYSDKADTKKEKPKIEFSEDIVVEKFDTSFFSSDGMRMVDYEYNIVCYTFGSSDEIECFQIEED